MLTYLFSVTRTRLYEPNAYFRWSRNLFSVYQRSVEITLYIRTRCPRNYLYLYE